MFITMFDEHYADWASLLIRSLARYHPNISVLAVGVDLTPATQSHCLSQHKCIEIWNRTLGINDEARPAAVANMRPRWLQEIVRSIRPQWCLFMDADLIVRSTLDDLILGSSASDAALVFRKGLHRGIVYRRLQVAAGLVLLRNSGFTLIERWCDLLDRCYRVDDVEPQAWFWEQICLLDAAEESRDLSISAIDPSRYLSSPPFALEASIWSANVKVSEKADIYDIFKAEVGGSDV